MLPVSLALDLAECLSVNMTPLEVVVDGVFRNYEVNASVIYLYNNVGHQIIAKPSDIQQ